MLPRANPRISSPLFGNEAFAAFFKRAKCYANVPNVTKRIHSRGNNNERESRALITGRLAAQTVHAIPR